MAERPYAHFIFELADRLQLPASGQKRLAEFWEDILEPHALAGVAELMDSISAREMDSFNVFRGRKLPVAERYKFGKLLLLEVLTNSLLAHYHPTAPDNTVRFYGGVRVLEDPRVTYKEYKVGDNVVFGHSRPAPQRETFAGVRVRGVNVAQSDDEAQTVVVLNAISDALKSAAQELASSNETIEKFLSSMESKNKNLQKGDTIREKEKDADERARSSP